MKKVLAVLLVPALALVMYASGLVPALVLVMYPSGLAFADGNIPTNTPGATAVAITSQQAPVICYESNVAAGSAIALTITAVPGMSFYMTSLEITLIAIAAPAATLTPTTTTGFGGTKSFRQAMQAVVGTDRMIVNYGPVGLKALQSTNVVFTGTVLANVSQNASACGYFAP